MSQSDITTAAKEKYQSLSDEAQLNLVELTHRCSPEINFDLKADARLLAVARTQFELGFMALNKAIHNPKNRVSIQREVGEID